jgi:hypothetical protein
MAGDSSRSGDLWRRRKGQILWGAVLAMAVVVALVIGIRVLPGATTPPRSFSFSFGANACNCTRETQTTHGFPSDASVRFHWWTSWTGANATVQMAVSKSNGSLVYLAISEYQQGNPYDLNVTWAQGGSGSFSGAGGPFTFLIDIVASPDFLPPDTSIWVNGTYTTPLV